MPLVVRNKALVELHNLAAQLALAADGRRNSVLHVRQGALDEGDH